MSGSATRKSSGGASSAGFLMGLILGLVLGLGIALGVAFYLSKTPMPFATRAKPAAETATESARPEGAKSGTMAGLPQGRQPDRAAEKPKYDFYKILPGGEEPVSDRDLKDRLRASRDHKAEAGKEIFFVQAGSFQNPADADALKGRIAMLGLESTVEPAHLPDKGTWYRVRLGPYTRLEEINKVRQSLAQSGIDGNLIRLKDASNTAKGN